MQKINWHCIICIIDYCGKKGFLYVTHKNTKTRPTNLFNLAPGLRSDFVKL